jgi:hypothetical protein
MNSACDNEERTDYDHEGQVIDSRVNDARGLLSDEEIIETNYAGKSDAKLVVMTLPMMLSNERSERDRHQQDRKRHHDRPGRACRDETRDPNHLAIGLIAIRSVNETRLCGGCFEERLKTLAARRSSSRCRRHGLQVRHGFDLSSLRKHVERRDGIDREFFLQFFQVTSQCGGIAGNVNYRRWRKIEN